MASTADFKNGMCLDIDGQYFYIVEFLHVKPGKGPAFVRTKLKNVTTGRVIDKTFNSGVKVDEVRIERRPYQFLYRDDMGYNFMNNETFEQVSIAKDSITGVDFLKEGDIAEVVVHADSETILYAELPSIGLIKIKDAETGHEQWIDTSSGAVRKMHHNWWVDRQTELNDIFTKSNVDSVSVRTDQDYVKALLNLFAKRN